MSPSATSSAQNRPAIPSRPGGGCTASRVLPIGERSAFRARACQDAKTSPNVASAAELLFVLEEPALAEQVIVERSGELDSRNYVLLTAWVKTAKANGRLLAAALIWGTLVIGVALPLAGNCPFQISFRFGHRTRG